MEKPLRHPRHEWNTQGRASPREKAQDQPRQGGRDHRQNPARQARGRNAVEQSFPGEGGGREPCDRSEDMEEPQDPASQGARLQAEQRPGVQREGQRRGRPVHESSRQGRGHVRG